MNDNTIDADVTMGGAADALLAGRYRVVKQLGQGGMGSVWLAEDVQLDNRQVAIKMLPSVLVSNKRAYQQLKAEALVSLKLTHPNIATVRAFEENSGNPFLVVDYIRGKDLDRCLADWGKLTEDETIALLMPIAQALDYAHKVGIVHRDVKPSNILIREDGQPFVADFGIAREVQETVAHVTGKLSSGTLMYMSPEQLKGSAPAPSQDVYAFAAVAYECLTGHPPFYRAPIEFQILNESPVLLPGDTQLGHQIMCALDKAPLRRPVTCVEIVMPPAAKSGISCKRSAEGESKRMDLKKRCWGVAVVLVVCLLSVLTCLTCRRGVKTDPPKDSLGLTGVGNGFSLDAMPGAVMRIGLDRVGTECGTRAVMSFCFCPAGSFVMGYEDAPAISQLRQVSISRPFWITQTPLTVEQMEAMGLHAKGDVSKGKAVRAQFDNAKTVIEDLPRVITNLLPKMPEGYALRLPTEAELEYVMKAGAVVGDPRLRMTIVDECDTLVNPWHVRSLFNSGILLLCDRVPPWGNNLDVVNRKNGKSNYWTDLVKVDYSSQPAVDPVAWSDADGWRLLRRGGGGGKYTAAQHRLYSCSAYFVVAPALSKLNKFYWK